MQKLSVPAVNKWNFNYHLFIWLLNLSNYIINKYYILTYFADLITYKYINISLKPLKKLTYGFSYSA